MANTTDIIITCFTNEPAIHAIADKTGIALRIISDASKVAGHKVGCYQTYGASYKCIGKDKIDQLIKEFEAAPWRFPELAALTIDDDNGDFCGVVTAA